MYPVLKDISRTKKDIKEFKGIDRRVGAEANTFYDCVNMTTAQHPYFSSRGARNKVFSVGAGEKIIGIFEYKGIFVITDYNHRTRIYYGTDFSSLSLAFTSNADEKASSVFLGYDGRACLFNLKTTIDEPSLLTSTVGSFSSPARENAPNFSDVMVHNNRIYGCRLKQIRVNGAGGIDDWEISYSEEQTPDTPFVKNYEVKENFTVCVNYKNKALFFNQYEMFELAGKDFTNYSLNKIADVGCVGRKSICEVDGVLYFVSNQGLMRYTGNMPTRICAPLCERSQKSESSVLGGGNGILYYKPQDILYTYNIEKDIWAKEDDMAFVYAFSQNSKMYLATERDIYEADCYGVSESFSWEAVTQIIRGDIENEMNNFEFYVRMESEKPSKAELYASFDGGAFELLNTFSVDGERILHTSISRRGYQTVRFKLCSDGKGRILETFYSHSNGGKNYAD